MAQKDGVYLKYLVVIIALILITTAGYYYFNKDVPIVYATSGELEITITMDKSLYLNNTTTIGGNITVKNIASTYRHIYLDINHFHYTLITNSTKYSDSHEISALFDDIKLEPNETYTFRFDLYHCSFVNYSVGEISLPLPGIYDLQFRLSDFDTSSNVVAFEILE